MKHHQAYSGQVQRIMQIAAAQARGLNHDFVGTEHLLLALVMEGSSTAARALEAMGADAASVRTEVERHVTRGPQPVKAAELPLTPRARLALEYAAQEARLLQQDPVSVEHLLMGLLREPDGVASLVARNLGIRHRELWQQILGVRLEQMKLVERAVRPVRGSTGQKRKMREELLSHLSSLYDEEHARLGDSEAAIEAASTRFGDPAELSRELERALPARERLANYMERWWGWRAPETATRWMARMAGWMFVVIALGCAPILAVSLAHLGWDSSTWIALSPGIATLAIVPAAQFLVGCLYFKMRDALWGAFGARSSPLRVALFAALMVLVISACGFGFIALAELNVAKAIHVAPVFGIFGVLGALAYYLQARLAGPDEIRDTIWACLDIQAD